MALLYIAVSFRRVQFALGRKVPLSDAAIVRLHKRGAGVFGQLEEFFRRLQLTPNRLRAAVAMLRRALSSAVRRGRWWQAASGFHPEPPRVRPEGSSEIAASSITTPSSPGSSRIHAARALQPRISGDRRPPEPPPRRHRHDTIEQRRLDIDAEQASASLRSSDRIWFKTLAHAGRKKRRQDGLSMMRVAP
jgi:hypothetical protein